MRENFTHADRGRVAEIKFNRQERQADIQRKQEYRKLIPAFLFLFIRPHPGLLPRGEGIATVRFRFCG
jgi:hypothetical protein